MFYTFLEYETCTRVQDTKSNFQLFCCIWHNIFGKKVEQSDLFVELLYFCLLKVWNIFLCFADDMSTSFCSDDN